MSDVTLDTIHADLRHLDENVKALRADMAADRAANDAAVKELRAEVTGLKIDAAVMKVKLALMCGGTGGAAGVLVAVADHLLTHGPK